LILFCEKLPVTLTTIPTVPKTEPAAESSPALSYPGGCGAWERVHGSASDPDGPGKHHFAWDLFEWSRSFPIFQTPNTKYVRMGVKR
jgi:hypothetical protein